MKKIIIALVILTSCNKDQTGHQCPYKLCPYKGIEMHQYNSVAECEEGSDCYYIDLLHLEHPYKDYDALEELLFGPGLIHY